MVATIYEWKEEKFKTIFGSRLRGDSLEWHIKRLQQYPTESYLDWSNAFKCHFQTEMDMERLKMRLFQLQQHPSEPVQYFIDTIVHKYDSIYERNQHQTLGNEDIQRPKDHEDICLKIFMNGVRPAIIKMILKSQLFEDNSWASVTKAAVLAERIIMARKLGPYSPAGSSGNNDVVLETEQQQKRKIPRCLH